jgi:hypothetical protein
MKSSDFTYNSNFTLFIDTKTQWAIFWYDFFSALIQSECFVLATRKVWSSNNYDYYGKRSKVKFKLVLSSSARFWLAISLGMMWRMEGLGSQHCLYCLLHTFNVRFIANTYIWGYEYLYLLNQAWKVAVAMLWLPWKEHIFEHRINEKQMVSTSKKTEIWMHMQSIWAKEDTKRRGKKIKRKR